MISATLVRSAGYLLYDRKVYLSASLNYVMDTDGGWFVFIFQGRTPDKMTSFSVVRKKTPFQKHRDEEDAKRKVKFGEHSALKLAAAQE